MKQVTTRAHFNHIRGEAEPSIAAATTYGEKSAPRGVEKFRKTRRDAESKAQVYLSYIKPLSRKQRRMAEFIPPRKDGPHFK